MNKFIEDFLISIHSNFLYPVYCYDTKTKKFGLISKNKIEEKPLPSIIAPILENNEIFSKTFIKDNEKTIFYFFRQFLDDRKIILILEDSPDSSNLNHFLSTILQTASVNYHDYLQTEREIDFMRDELNECESEISSYDKKLMDIEDELYEKSKELEHLEDLVSILQTSKNKLIKLIDAIHLPIFSIDLNKDITNINRSLANYLKIEDLPSFIGRKCYKLIYNNFEKCEWCKIDEVIETKAPVTQQINVKFNAKKYIFLQTMFPILNEKNEVIEIGEYLTDITSTYKILDSFDSQIFNYDNISKDYINQIEDLDKSKYICYELLEDIEQYRYNTRKLNIALKKMLNQDIINEYSNLKKELKNYEIKFNKQKEILNQLNKKVIYSMERLFNILNNKQELLEEDTKKVLEFLNSQIKILKENIFQEDSDNVSKSSD